MNNYKNPNKAIEKRKKEEAKFLYEQYPPITEEEVFTKQIPHQHLDINNPFLPMGIKYQLEEENKKKQEEPKKKKKVWVL
jgi:hypothetical protein